LAGKKSSSGSQRPDAYYIADYSNITKELKTSIGQQITSLPVAYESVSLKALTEKPFNSHDDYVRKAADSPG